MPCQIRADVREVEIRLVKGQDMRKRIPNAKRTNEAGSIAPRLEFAVHVSSRTIRYLCRPDQGSCRRDRNAGSGQNGLERCHAEFIIKSEDVLL